MPLDQLLQALEREANATRDDLLAAARAEADQLAAASEANLSAQRDRSVDEQVQELRQCLDDAFGKVTHQARAKVLGAREELVEQVIAALLAALPSAVGREDYQEQLPSRLDAALAAVAADEPVIVRCSPVLASPVESALSGRSGARVEPDAKVGSGFVLVAPDRGLEVDDTLDVRVQRQRMQLAREALKQLKVPA